MIGKLTVLSAVTATAALIRVVGDVGNSGDGGGKPNGPRRRGRSGAVSAWTDIRQGLLTQTGSAMLLPRSTPRFGGGEAWVPLVLMQVILHRVGNGGDNGSVSDDAAVRRENGSGE